MTDFATRLHIATNTRRRFTAERPIDFETWLDVSFERDACGNRVDTELIKGVMVEKMAAQYPHEWIFMWLARFLGDYVEDHELGVVLGSRSAVQIDSLGGRLPDLLFVRAENRHIIGDRAIYGVPDLVIEIVSDNDRAGDLRALESDYRRIGVPEIVFLYPKKRRTQLKNSVRLLRKNGAAYDEFSLTSGPLEFACVPGFRVEVASIFAADKPKVSALLRELAETASANKK